LHIINKTIELNNKSYILAAHNEVLNYIKQNKLIPQIDIDYISDN